MEISFVSFCEGTVVWVYACWRDSRRQRTADDLGVAENTVGADAPEDVGIVAHLKRETVAFGDPAFPDILAAFHFLDA